MDFREEILASFDLISQILIFNLQSLFNALSDTGLTASASLWLQHGYFNQMEELPIRNCDATFVSLFIYRVYIICIVSTLHILVSFLPNYLVLYVARLC